MIEKKDKENILTPYGVEVKSRVPKILIQFWDDKADLPKEYKDVIQNNKQYIDGYEVLFADDTYMLDFFKKSDSFLYQLYKSIQIESVRSDFARLALLSKFGGIYLDISIVLLKPLELMIHKNSEIGLLLRDDQLRYQKYPKSAHIANGILYAVKDAHFIKECFNNLLDSIVGGYYNHLVSFATTKMTYKTYINYKNDSNLLFHMLSFKELKKDFLKHLRVKGLANSWKYKEQMGIIKPEQLPFFQKEYEKYKK